MKVLMVVALLLAVAALIASPSGAQDSKGLMAGACSAVITPDKTVYLAGGDHGPSKGVHDDIFCRVLVLKSGKDALAIASVDLIGFMAPDVAAVRKALKSVPPERLIIVATHCHSAPDPIGLWGPEGKSGVDKEWMASVRQKMVDCIETAANNLAPARLKFASGELKGVSRNWNDPEILDLTLALMQVEAADGSKTIATLVNYANHPEVMNVGMITADWVGYMYKRLESKLGGIAVFANGALGAMVSPIDDDAHKAGADNWAIAERIGNQTADRAAELLADAKPVAAAALNIKSAPVIAPLENKKFIEAVQAGVLPDIATEGNVNTEVSVAVIGPAQIATLPGEAEPRIGLQVKELMTGSPKFVFGLANNELGYLLLPENYGTQKFEYETSMSVGKGIAPAVTDALKTLLAEVKPEVASVKEWVESLPKTVSADKIGNLNAVYQLTVSGEGGGIWTITAKDKALAVAEGKAAKANCTIEVSAADWLAILNRKLDAVSAYFAGKLNVSDEDLAMRFGELLLP